MKPTKRRGRRRSHNPTIPAHIDQGKIPTGCYWDKSGNGRWYVQERAETGRLRNRRIAGRDATLADLHRVVEEWRGVDRNTLIYVADEFEQSPTFQALSKSTRKDYRYCRAVVCAFPSKTGQPLGAAPLNRWTIPTTQKLIDALAAAGTPSKANHVLRYLRRLFKWALARGHMAHNPALGVEQAKERKRRTMPTQSAYGAVLAYAKARGALQQRSAGSCAPYLWMVMELAFLCRLRGIEVVTLTDANEQPEGLRTNRRKGSRDNIVEWTPRLRAAWDAAKALRDQFCAKYSLPTSIKPLNRWVFMADDGHHLRKSSLDTAWQRLIISAIADGVIPAAERFSLHGLKRKGITDTPGTRQQKQLASGHRQEAMLDVYDQSIPLVKPAGE